MPTCVELKEVSLTYRNGTSGLCEVSLIIETGEFVFLVSPTGHGKSSFLKLLYCEQTPTSGQVLVFGSDVTRLSPTQVAHLRRTIGVVFQDSRLLPQRTAWENVAFALHAAGANHHTSLRRVPQALADAGLLEKADAYPSQLSAGEQQRLSLARALAVRPQLVLADEPTGNLDPQSSSEVLTLLTKANQDSATVIVATHDPVIVNSARRRVIALRHGRVINDLNESGYPDDLGFD